MPSWLVLLSAALFLGNAFAEDVAELGQGKNHSKAHVYLINFSQHSNQETLLPPPHFDLTPSFLINILYMYSHMFIQPRRMCGVSRHQLVPPREEPW
jgi:hypothetical protein